MVISDSHGNVTALTTALEWAQQQRSDESTGSTPAFDTAIFLGDGADDLLIASARAGFTSSWHTVRGNGDFNFSIPQTLVLEIPGTTSRKLFMAHGNRHGVDVGGLTMATAARSVGAEAALFGHTHVPHCSMVNGIFLLNPGSIGRSRSNAGPTFAVLDCPAKGPLSARFYCLVNKGRKVQELEL